MLELVIVLVWGCVVGEFVSGTTETLAPGRTGRHWGLIDPGLLSVFVGS